MANTIDRFELVLEGNEKVGAGFPSFSNSSFHHELKDASKALLALDNDLFDENQVVQKKLPLLLTDAYIVDRTRQLVVASKHYLGEHDILEYPPGVYLRVNPRAISVDRFQRMTGRLLPEGPVKAMEAGYFLVAAAAPLQRQGFFQRMRKWLRPTVDQKPHRKLRR